MKALMRKILSVLLITAAAVSPVITSGCFAEDGEEWKNNTGEIDLDNMSVSGDGVSADGNTVKITNGGDFTVTGTLTDGMIYVNSSEKVKLRLCGASISNSDGPAIYFDSAEKAFITITDGTENYISDGKSYSDDSADGALFSNDDLEIKGGGVLNITGSYKHGIAGDDDVSIENGVININSYEHGIKANDTLSVSGGEISVRSETGKGMKADLEVVIDGGMLNVESMQSEGIESKGTLTINDGNINVTAADDGINTGSESGTDQAGGFEPHGKMQTPPDGMTPPEMPVGKDGMDRDSMDKGGIDRDGMDKGGMGRGGMAMDEETAAAHAITINGGNIYVNAEGDGIDSNGSLTINGGTVTIDGPVNSGNGPLDAEAGITVNGGTVMTASSAGMLMLPAAADGINTLRLFFDKTQTAGTTVSVKETDEGTEIMKMTPAKSFQAAVYTSAKLKSGTNYTIYIDGAEYESFTAESGVTDLGNAGFGGMGGHADWNGLRGNNGNGASKNDGIKVFVNNRRIRFDTEPIIKNDAALVEFRTILEALGAEVSWDGDTQTVTAVGNGATIKLKINSNKADVNGKSCELSAAPEIINDRTLVPVRFLSEQLGMSVDWDGEMRLINISLQAQ